MLEETYEKYYNLEEDLDHHQNNNSVEVKYLDSNQDMMLNTNFIMEVNMIEVPLCRYKNRRKISTVNDLLNNKEISSLAKEILCGIPEKSRNSQMVDILSWSNSKGEDKEILAISARHLPSSFDMEVFHALVGLYIKKNSPISYKHDDNNRKILNIPAVLKVDFKLIELCEYMNLRRNGSNYKRIKEAIRNLNAVHYYSLGSGVFYDKKCDDYVVTSLEKNISLIDSYDLFNQKVKKRSSMATDICWVKFGELVTENLRYNYIKFLSQSLYFTLPTGLTRRLYSYLIANRYNMPYIKRQFDTLGYKIPLDFNYPSELKRKLNKPLKELIEFGVIKDFWWGDEIFINGIKEHCLYVSFKKNKFEIISELESKMRRKHNIKLVRELTSEKDITNLTFPSDMRKELLHLGVSEKAADDMLCRFAGKKKYELAEYILWVKYRMKEVHVDNPPGLLTYAITPSCESNSNFVTVAKTHPFITEFVMNYKKEIEGESFVSQQELEKEFKKYIDKQLKSFKKEDPDFYENYIVKQILDSFSNVYEVKIKSQKKLYNMANEDEKKCIQESLRRWEEYPKLKEKSELFRRELIKRCRLLRGFMTYEEFKDYYLNKR